MHRMNTNVVCARVVGCCGNWCGGSARCGPASSGATTTAGGAQGAAQWVRRGQRCGGGPMLRQHQDTRHIGQGSSRAPGGRHTGSRMCVRLGTTGTPPPTIVVAGGGRRRVAAAAEPSRGAHVCAWPVPMSVAMRLQRVACVCAARAVARQRCVARTVCRVLAPMCLRR